MWACFVFPPCNFFSFDSPLAMLNFLDSPLGCTFYIGYFVQIDLKSANFLHPKEETKKIYFAKDESKEKKLQEEKKKLAHIT